jgi:D-beta-D-heptose 7-phosphate kinase/D-beta-D-heptose 1-phosphate adenosyltransferase
LRVEAKRLERIINRFRGKHILVVGDLILDHYIFGEAERISPEAPVPVLWANQEKFLGGGAVNVALNLIDLGAQVSLCGVVGDDHFGKVLLGIIKEKGIDTNLIIKDKTRPTTIKTRVVAFHQQVVRVDWESKQFLSLEITKKVLGKIRRVLPRLEGVIIEDYGKGVVNPSLVEELVNLGKKNKKIITVDPKEEHFDYYQNVTALTPNLKEAQIAANISIKSKEEMNLLGELIMEKLRPKALLITLGEEGMRLFLGEGKVYRIPTYALEVYDVTGAGDTVIAVFTLSLLAGASFLEAAVICNLAAGIVVGKLGAATVGKRELISRIRKADLKFYRA